MSTKRIFLLVVLGLVVGFGGSFDLATAQPAALRFDGLCQLTVFESHIGNKRIMYREHFGFTDDGGVLGTVSAFPPFSQEPAQKVGPDPGKQATRLSESEAATKLDEILLKQNLAADVFVADVDGNGAPDFVAIYTAGRGKVLQKLGLSTTITDREKGLIQAEFALMTLGTISVMQNETLDWEADLVYLVAFDDLKKVPVQKVSQCHSVASKPEEWRICLVRAWTTAEATPREKATFDHLLSQRLPPNGFVKRFQEQTPTGLFPITVEGLGLHHLVTLRDSQNGELRAMVFVKAGQSVWMELPTGSYKMHYARGKEWEGPDKLFGPETRCFEMEKVFESPPASSQLGLIPVAPLSDEPARTIKCAAFGHGIR